MARRSSLSFLTFIAVIIFIISVIVSGGVYAWKTYLEKQKAQMELDLKKNKQAFEPQTIEEYVRLNNRFDAAKKLLEQHVAVSAVFDILQARTLSTVRFKDFKYAFQNDGSVAISMVGEAKTYNSVAYQSQVFSKERAFKGIVFSNLDLDKSGNIIFKFDTRVEPKLVSYKNNLQSYSGSDVPVAEDATSGEAEANSSQTTEE